MVAVPLTVLSAVIGTAMALQLQERQERRIAVAGNNLSRTALAVLADSVDAETGIRGYCATHDPLFLEPYTAAVTKVIPDLKRLSAAASGDREDAQADAIAVSVTQQFALLGRMHAAAAAGGTGAALGPALQNGKTIMDRLRRQIADLIRTPLSLVDQRRAGIDALESKITSIGLAGLVFGLVAGLIGIALFSSGIARRVRTAAANAGRLGRGEFLISAAKSGDELGRLEESLNDAATVLADHLLDVSTARDQALAATATKNSFVSRTSHELRTPLNAILGFAQLLELADLGDDDRDSTRRIIGAGRHLLSLINELIDIARVESGDLGLSLAPVRLGELVDETAELIAPLAADRGITVEKDVADTTLAAYGDRQRLRQIMINLASNAVKYNHHGGVISLSCRPAGGEAELVVCDTGAGLSATDIDKIFLPFERLEAERQGIEGTGIGLALALALTEAMHGRLTVESVVGQGSTFTVRLPAAAPIDVDPAGDPMPAPFTVPPSRGEPAGEHRLTVLSIEDNPANSEVLARMFRGRPGTTYHSAISGQAGLALAARTRPDVVLLDLHLPDMPGEEVLAGLRAQPHTAATPIVVLSADAAQSTIQRLRDWGVTEYLTKPIDLKELSMVLDTIATEADHQPQPRPGPL